MINIVNSAKSKKACGYDNIDPYVVQQVISQIATQLAHMFNRSFSTGIVPNKLKIAKVIPIIIQKRKILNCLQTYLHSSKYIKNT